MKIFISWSGHRSHKIAIALREWLKSVIQNIETPYLSSKDIGKGERWSSSLASELDKTSFGIICITKENANASWLNFEAGAIGKSADGRVCPLLYGIKKSDITGPLSQFQLTVLEKDEVFEMMKSINKEFGSLEDTELKKSFERCWPELESALASIDDMITEETYEQEHSLGDIEDTDDYYSRHKDSFAIVDIMSAHDLWDNFEGILYAWNPSWQTELATNPDEWMKMHINRYTDNKINKVIYIIAENGPKMCNRQFYYKRGFLDFLKAFFSKAPELHDKIRTKMKVYLINELTSDLTFFVDERNGEDVALLLINDEPFCHKGVPVWAFVTWNANIVSMMKSMIIGATAESKMIDINDLMDEQDEKD